MFFKNSEHLEEHVGEDLLGMDEEINRVSEKLEYLFGRKRNAIVAYLGPFGMGKSTILKNSLDGLEGKCKSLSFELWRYSDRDKIWDGFVVEVSSLLRDQKPTEIIDEIEGKRWNAFQHSIDQFSLVWVVGISFLWIGASMMVWSLLYRTHWPIFLFAEAFLKYSFPLFLAFLGVIGLGRIMPQPKRPLRRIFELEEELRVTLKRLEAPLLIVIEDIDRTGEEGMVFLETLRNFLKDERSNFNKPVIAITPQSANAFNIVGNHNQAVYFERSAKIYDFEMHATKHDLWVSGLENFFDQLQPHSHKEDLRQIAESIAGSYSQQITIRILKRGLRAVDEFMDSCPSANPGIVFVLALSKYVAVNRQYSEGRIPVNQTLKKARLSDTKEARPFGRLLLHTLGSEEPIRDFDISFMPRDDEGSVEVETHRSGEKTGHIELDSKYEIIL